LISILVAFALGGTAHVHMAQAAERSAADLTGSWRGGGSVTLALGATEQARCRALFRRAGENSYTVDATCATPSGRAAQTATVHRVSENRYTGSFYNSEYSISGTIHIVVRGGAQTVRLVSDSASAVINLTR
jgi:hypothetical protein